MSWPRVSTRMMFLKEAEGQVHCLAFGQKRVLQASATYVSPEF